MTYSDEMLELDEATGEPDAPPKGGRVGIVVHAIGAVMSLALVIGLVAWGVHQLRRDVSGVAVIPALADPMRERPENPGGAQAAHQGMAVNAVQEGAGAGTLAEAVVLAPAPVEIRPEDVAAIAAAQAAETAPVAANGIDEETRATIERIVALAEPLEPLEPASADTDGPQIIDASIPGVARSLVPVARPEGLRERVEAAAVAAAARQVAAAEVEDVTGSSSVPEDLAGAGAGTDRPVAAGPVDSEIDAAALTPGTRLVQLGAYDDPQTARVEWDRLTAAFPDFFIGRDRVVQEAVSGGQPFYRLRAHGFADLSDARRFCTALLAEGAACIPVTVR